MSGVATPRKRPSLRSYATALGRAHGKARGQLAGSMPLLVHLEELRQRIFKAFGAVLLTTMLSFGFAGPLIDFLASPIGGRPALVSIEVTENLTIFMRVSLLSGLVLGMPFVVYQALRFILPGLKTNERTWLLLGVPAASLLFVSGVAFTWFMMLPTALPFLINFLGITTEVRPLNYFDFVTTMMVWIGLCFEMPLVVVLLARVGLVTPGVLAAGWRYAVVAISLVAALITPTIDPVTMLLVMLPLLGLYAISILLAWLVARRRTG